MLLSDKSLDCFGLWLLLVAMVIDTARDSLGKFRIEPFVVVLDLLDVLIRRLMLLFVFGHHMSDPHQLSLPSSKLQYKSIKYG